MVLDFIFQCKAKGFTGRQIMNHLNKNGIKNERQNRPFTIKDIIKFTDVYRKIIVAEKAYRVKHGTGLKPWQFITPDLVVCERFDKQEEKKAYYDNLRTYDKNRSNKGNADDMERIPSVDVRDDQPPAV